MIIKKIFVLHVKIQNKFKKQGEKMMKFSKEKFPQLEIGTTVRVTTPDVDRARGSPRNILAVVTQVVHDLYKLCKLILNEKIYY